MRKSFVYLPLSMFFIGILLAIIVYFKIKEDIRLDYQSFDNLIAETFLPFFSINLIFLEGIYLF